MRHCRNQPNRSAGCRLTALLLIILGAGGLLLIYPADSVGEPIDQLISSAMRRGKMVGLSVAAIRGSRVIYRRGFGKADIETNRFLTIRTPVLLSSVSKLITGIAALRLVEQGVIDLDQDIDSFLPWSIRNPAFPDTPITLRQLLSHSSSIKDSDRLYDGYTRGDAPTPLSQFVENYLQPGGQFYDTETFHDSPPGSIYDYSNVGITLIGFLVERISGRPFDQYCHDEIFLPLGMRDTAWKLDDFDSNSVAVPYEYAQGRYTTYFKNFPYYGYPDYPDGQLRSSLGDMTKFLRMLLLGGTFRDTIILSSASLEQMYAEQFPDLEKGQGLVFYRERHAGRLLLGHNGGDFGSSTFMFFSPKNRRGILLLGNTTAAAAADSRKIEQSEEEILSELYRLSAKSKRH